MSYDKHIFWLRECDDDELDSELRFARRECRYHHTIVEREGTLQSKVNFNAALRFWYAVLQEIEVRYGVAKRR